MKKEIGKLSTHVLDNYSGRPANGIKIDLSVYQNGKWKLIKSLITNKDGRTDYPLLEGEAMDSGYYEILFQVGTYYQTLGVSLPTPPFLTEVPIRFNVFDPQQKYHVPLLMTPWSFATYRGS